MLEPAHQQQLDALKAVANADFDRASRARRADAGRC
jgi:hypothetical protein